MKHLATAKEMRELDRITIEELGIPGAVLMENAGRALADEVRRVAKPGARVAVVCGAGNNGGDGFVCARWLMPAFRTAVHLVAGRPRTGDASLFLAAYERQGGEVVETLGDAVTHADVIVDAILGTGIKSEVHGDLAKAIELINDSPATRISADIPSGLNSDTGQIMGIAVKATRTVTFGMAKIGIVSSPGFETAGVVRVADIGIPALFAARVGITTFVLEEADVSLPSRSPSGHKGNYGHLLVIGGSLGKPGAALLCAGAALRSGAGLVTLATSPETRGVVEGRLAEVMYESLDYAAGDALSRVEQIAAGKRVIVWGPGMPTSRTAGDVLRGALGVLDMPVVLDADALNHVSRDLSMLVGARAPRVLTPHPGEAARLLGLTTGAVQADRLEAARTLAMRTGAVVVLKGARTIISSPDGQCRVNPTGNPALAKGGTGDVLAGVIGALIGQGLASYEAACTGVYIHGLAGDLGRERRGELGLVAGDVIELLPLAVQTLASSRQNGMRTGHSVTAEGLS